MIPLLADILPDPNSPLAVGWVLLVLVLVSGIGLLYYAQQQSFQAKLDRADHRNATAIQALSQEQTATLARGDARGALLLLDGYDKTCPQGRLRLEAELLRIDALAKSGQAQAAKRHAQTFLRHHPGSVLAARARSYLASGDNLGD